MPTLLKATAEYFQHVRNFR